MAGTKIEFWFACKPDAERRASAAGGGDPYVWEDPYDYKAVNALEAKLRYCDPGRIKEVLAEYAPKLPGLGARATKNLYAGCVVGTHARSERVMSDDYEDRHYVTLWHPSGDPQVRGQWKVYAIDGYVGYKEGKTLYLPGCEQTEPSAPDGSKSVRVVMQWRPDLTPEHQEQYDECVAEQSRAADVKIRGVRFWEENQNAEREALRIHTDMDVAVVKGRKVPRASGYRITAMGHGQYGQWAHLTGRDGLPYRYVSVSNLRAEPNWEVVFKDAHPLPEVCTLIAAAYATKDAGMEAYHVALGILFDFIGDLPETHPNGSDDPAAWRWIGGYEAAGYLREKVGLFALSK